MNAQDATKIISSRKRILGPGSYDLKVTSVGVNKDGNFIVNLNAMTQYHIEQALALFSDGTEESFQAATNQHLTANARLGTGDYLPVKNEFVRVMVDEITTKNGVTGLFVVGLNKIQATQAGVIDFDSLLKREEIILQQDPVLV